MKHNVGDLVKVKTANHGFRVGDMGYVSDIVDNDGTEYWIRFEGFHADYGFSADSLEPAWIADRVKTTVRIERKLVPEGVWTKSRGRVYVDVTFDACKLQTLIVYSGDLETAEKIYAGQLRLTAGSELEPVE